MYELQDIREIHLEITQHCQASCPMCDRNKNGGEINPHINMSELSLQDCQQIFTPEFISQLNSMYMCGNLGDPVVAKDTLSVFKYFRQHNPTMWLGMNTNGGARDSTWWQELAQTFGKNGAVIFSIDGLEDTNHIYRQNVVWSKVVNSFTSFILAGGRARWDYLIFEHNQHQVETAQQMAQQLGFEKFIPKKTGRFVTANTQLKQEHVVVKRTRSQDKQMTVLKKPDTQYQNTAVKNLVSLIEKHGSIDSYHDSVEIVCKVKKSNSLFITAEGLALPCCWTAGRMYKWWHVDPHVEQIWKIIDSVGGKEKINAKNGLQQVFDTNIFKIIQAGWAIDSCQQGKLKVCAMKCGTEFDPFTSQFE